MHVRLWSVIKVKFTERRGKSTPSVSTLEKLIITAIKNLLRRTWFTSGTFLHERTARFSDVLSTDEGGLLEQRMMNSCLTRGKKFPLPRGKVQHFVFSWFR